MAFKISNLFSWLEYVGIGTQSHTFRTSLTTDQAKDIVSEKLDRDGLWGWLNPGTIRWSPKEDGFRLRVSIAYRNSFQSLFYMRLRPENRGCTIEGKFLWSIDKR